MLFSILFTLLSLSTRADLITNLNSNLRDQGYYSVFYSKAEKGIQKFYKGICYTDRLNIGPANRNSCRKNPQKISLSDLLNLFTPNLESDLFQMVQLYREQSRNGSIDENFLKFMSIHFEKNLEGTLLSSLLKKVEENKKEQTRRSELIKKLLKVYEPKLEIISLILDTKDHFVLHENLKSNLEQAKLVALLTTDFEDSHYQAVGFQCANPRHPDLEQKHGGCTLKTNGLTYAEPEFISDRLQDHIWLNRDVANARCRGLSAGGYYDWRLPTEDELLKATNASNAIGFDSARYYWTENIKKENLVERKLYELGNKFIDKQTRPILTGFVTKHWYNVYGNYRQSSEPVFEMESISKIEADRKLYAKFLLEETSFKLVRPSQAKSFDTKRYRLTGATGQMKSQLVEKTATPGFIQMVTIGNLLAGDINEKSFPEVKTWDFKEKVLKNLDYEVNPFDYVQYELPADVLKSEIGLLCVRKQEEKRLP